MSCVCVSVCLVPVCVLVFFSRVALLALPMLMRLLRWTQVRSRKVGLFQVDLGQVICDGHHDAVVSQGQQGQRRLQGNQGLQGHQGEGAIFCAGRCNVSYCHTFCEFSFLRQHGRQWSCSMSCFMCRIAWPSRYMGGRLPLRYHVLMRSIMCLLRTVMVRDALFSSRGFCRIDGRV